MITVSVKLEGAKEFDRSLGRLERNVSKKVVRKAVREAQKPVLKSAKNLASIVVGGTMGNIIKKNLVLRAFKKQKRGSFGVAVRIKGESEGADPRLVHFNKGAKTDLATGKTTGRTFIPAALEFGHGSKKAAAATPFLRPAADMNKRRTLAILTKEIGRGIDQEMRKK